MYYFIPLSTNTQTLESLSCFRLSVNKQILGAEEK